MSETTAGSDVVAMKIKADKKGYNCFLFVCFCLCVLLAVHMHVAVFLWKALMSPVIRHLDVLIPITCENCVQNRCLVED